MSHLFLEPICFIIFCSPFRPPSWFSIFGGSALTSDLNESRLLVNGLLNGNLLHILAILLCSSNTSTTSLTGLPDPRAIRLIRDLFINFGFVLSSSTSRQQESNKFQDTCPAWLLNRKFCDSSLFSVMESMIVMYRLIFA